MWCVYPLSLSPSHSIHLECFNLLTHYAETSEVTFNTASPVFLFISKVMIPLDLNTFNSSQSDFKNIKGQYFSVITLWLLHLLLSKSGSSFELSHVEECESWKRWGRHILTVKSECALFLVHWQWMKQLSLFDDRSLSGNKQQLKDIIKYSVSTFTENWRHLNNWLNPSSLLIFSWITYTYLIYPGRYRNRVKKKKFLWIDKYTRAHFVQSTEV